MFGVLAVINALNAVTAGYKPINPLYPLNERIEVAPEMYIEPTVSMQEYLVRCGAPLDQPILLETVQQYQRQNNLAKNVCAEQQAVSVVQSQPAEMLASTSTQASTSNKEQIRNNNDEMPLPMQAPISTNIGTSNSQQELFNGDAATSTARKRPIDLQYIIKYSRPMKKTKLK